MTDPTDWQARRRIAEDTDATLFVSAGAGSGKTTALVQRVITLVLRDGIPISSVAAVTFTAKAAAELRDRLRVAFERVEPADEGADRATVALDQLDLAAIGTLHAFAQRILAAHPIEAGLPPALEVLDEVASSIAFEERWSRIQQQLLDDDEVAEALILGMSAGVKLTHVRQLFRLLSQDWDRVDTHILAHPPMPLAVPNTTALDHAAREVQDLIAACKNSDCKLLAKILVLQNHIERARTTTSSADLVEASEIFSSWTPGAGGRKADWPGREPKSIRDRLRELAAECLAPRNEVVGLCLRNLTHWIGARVLGEAEERRRSGQLEFHDLLVISRDLLGRSADVRETLHGRYERLLLDEFQDTDPIQIELAVRIAGGRDADQPRWEDVAIPDGRLFVVGDAKQSIYRFRRASIRTFLTAQRAIGEQVALSSNFRSRPGVVDWVNDVFGQLIDFEPDGQPAYEPLVAHRIDPFAPTGPAVAVVGAEELPKSSADELRRVEAGSVADAIQQVLAEGWGVRDEETEGWRAARPSDIAILLPSRASMPMLEKALDGAGIHFRAEAMSLVYEAPEVRDLLIAARALSDPSDELALVSALRSPLFGCGDDDLWRWKQSGARFTLFATTDDRGLSAGPVGQALDYLRALHRRARWMAPSEVLAALVEDRRMLEVGALSPRMRDSWRRIRFVVDQARAWSEVSHGGLRDYVAWVAHQAQEKARVSEAVLPEQDVDAVRVMTVHAAKGLEFPIVVMSGMTTRPNRSRGVRLFWSDDDYSVSLRQDLKDPSFEELAAVDEQMGELERTRLLYVAATRAKDHLLVSLHRGPASPTSATTTPAMLIARAESLTATDSQRLEPAGLPAVMSPCVVVQPPPAWNVWKAAVEHGQKASRTTAALTASGLEGTEPEVVMAEAVEAGRAKGPRNLELPPWSKGRYGSAVGRAVHGVLQVVDLATGAGLDDAVRTQVLAEGIVELEDTVTALARAALDSDVVIRAAQRPHWREVYVGAPRADGTLIEGVIDLLYREDDGSYVVVDYKTDVVSSETIDERAVFYRPQLVAYRGMLTATVSGPIALQLLFLHPNRATPVDV